MQLKLSILSSFYIIIWRYNCFQNWIPVISIFVLQLSQSFGDIVASIKILLDVIDYKQCGILVIAGFFCSTDVKCKILQIFLGTLLSPTTVIIVLESLASSSSEITPTRIYSRHYFSSVFLLLIAADGFINALKNPLPSF